MLRYALSEYPILTYLVLFGSFFLLFFSIFTLYWAYRSYSFFELIKKNALSKNLKDDNNNTAEKEKNLNEDKKLLINFMLDKSSENVIKLKMIFIFFNFLKINL